jgi:hypothetical protein
MERVTFQGLLRPFIQVVVFFQKRSNLVITNHTSRWIRLAVLSLSPLLALLLVGNTLAASNCKKINGKVILQALPSSSCLSAIDLCASGSLSGDLVGTSSFTGTSQAVTADTPATSVILLTGDNAIHTSGGTLMTKDAIVLQTTGNGQFGEVDTVVGGTGEWAGATGTFRAVGTFANGVGQGDYIGEICTP